MTEGNTTTDPYEYAVRYTDDTGQSGIAYDPDKFDPCDRAFADMRARGMRSAQEDRDIPKDATLMRRLPGGEWDEDPGWAHEIATWNQFVARIEAAATEEERREARAGLDAWVEFTTVARETGQITVKVRDYSAEAPWGVGLTNPVVRSVVISAYCVVCGCPRGMPREIHQ